MSESAVPTSRECGGNKAPILGLRPFMPYAAVNGRQLDRRWLDAGHGVEAIFFELPDSDDITRASRVLRALPHTTAKTIHHTMHGNYVRDSRARTALHRVVELAGDVGAEGVVVHANHFVDVEDVPTTDFTAQRRSLVQFFADFDRDTLSAMDLWLGIENMPLIGDLGDDVDAAFVQPSDFDGVSGDKVGITLDTAHLVGAVETRSAAPLGARAMLPPGQLPQLDAFGRLSSKIVHLHVSAVTGLALPPRASYAAGGGVPDADDTRYETIIRSVLRHGLGASLEVAESDYEDRINLWRMLNWLTNRSLVA